MTDSDSARDRALARDAEARARLGDDLVYRIKQRRDSRRNEPDYQPRPEVLVLTPREIEVLSYLSRGLELQMVADAMGVGHETVKSRLKTARAKLRAKNGTHACCEAIRRGLIP